MPDGLLVVYKPIGCSSHDVIAKIRRMYKVKCGHAGTLDPMAQGVLLVFTGRALKLINFITPEHLDKTYLMKVTLGSTTDSYDATGQVTETFDGPIDFSNEQLISVLRNFVGSYEQVPPAFSAIKVGGKRAYALARAGEEVKLASRKVHVTSIRLVQDFVANDTRNLLLRVHCSRGTYVRSIAHDLGQKLGCGGHLSYLLRERVGKWAFTNAFPFWKIEKGLDFSQTESFIDFSEILPFPRLMVNRECETKIRNGLPIGFKDISKVEGDHLHEDQSGLVQIISEDGKLVAIYGPRKKSGQPGKNQAKLAAVRVFPENEA
ncbi:MAG: tRNA pseudouridine55 synthase [Clostridiales bacterium]|jgi:tRNA pseudouridine55 synthase|nr:tRNA pseudouridine55 synthase [Clostridiales bacterium]MDN5281683.1 tRNA pseudouridine55 synthase [Candidatus Ozemobacter sp.]